MSSDLDIILTDIIYSIIEEKFDPDGNQVHIAFRKFVSRNSLFLVEYALSHGYSIRMYDVKAANINILVNSRSVGMSDLLIKNRANIHRGPLISQLIYNRYVNWKLAQQPQHQGIYLGTLRCEIENIKHILELGASPNLGITLLGEWHQGSIDLMLHLLVRIMEFANSNTIYTIMGEYFEIMNSLLHYGAKLHNVKLLLPVYEILSNSILCKILSQPINVPLEIVQFALDTSAPTLKPGRYGYTKYDIVINTIK